MFRFSARFIGRVQEYFGSSMSPRLQEAIDEGDHVTVTTLLRGSHEWQTKEDVIEAILTKSFIEVKAMANRERQLKEIRDRCAFEVCDHCGISHAELVRN